MRSRERGNKVYWDCQKVRSRECIRRAITAVPARLQDEVVVIKGLSQLSHTYPPNQEQCKAEQVLQGIKRKAAEYLE